jgi:hypothetical protein
MTKGNAKPLPFFVGRDEPCAACGHLWTYHDDHPCDARPNTVFKTCGCSHWTATDEAVTP